MHCQLQNTLLDSGSQAKHKLLVSVDNLFAKIQAASNHWHRLDNAPNRPPPSGHPRQPVLLSSSALPATLSAQEFVEWIMESLAGEKHKPMPVQRKSPCELQ